MAHGVDEYHMMVYITRLRTGSDAMEALESPSGSIAHVKAESDLHWTT